MVQHRPCANTACSNTTRLKYRFCEACRLAGITAAAEWSKEANVSAEQYLAQDRAARIARREDSQLKKQYEEALKVIDRQDWELRALNILSQGADTFTIEPKLGKRSSEATAVWVASDWHMEEQVDPRTVSGLNTYNTEKAKARATTFFQSAVRLTQLLHKDVNITTIVLALLGDFISNDIHEEIAESAEMAPMHAITLVQSSLTSGIEFVLANTDQQMVIVCHSGNHARTTKTTRFATENGHSLEYLLYLSLASYFRHEPRISFVISEGYHSFLQVYDQTIRFHHGHAVRYGGGVGGIFIPAYKAIAQWNKARRADLDVFGHFHQMKDGGNFLCNGSLIGYNAFAVSIKADYEPPRQTLFLVDKKRGRTCTWPILVESK
jgi:hypothetical protein